MNCSPFGDQLDPHHSGPRRIKPAISTVRSVRTCVLNHNSRRTISAVASPGRLRVSPAGVQRKWLRCRRPATSCMHDEHCRVTAYCPGSGRSGAQGDRNHVARGLPRLQKIPVALRAIGRAIFHYAGDLADGVVTAFCARATFVKISAQQRQQIRARCVTFNIDRIQNAAMVAIAAAWPL